MDIGKVVRLAKVASPLFVWDARTNGDKFMRVADGAPEWVSHLAMYAHGNMMPDDWRYRFISDAVDAISEMVDDGDEDAIQDRGREWEPSVYNAALLEWLSSNLHRIGYVDEAVEELEHSSRGVMGDIAMGQYEEFQETFNLVCEFLDELEEDETEEDG